MLYINIYKVWFRRKIIDRKGRHFPNGKVAWGFSPLNGKIDDDDDDNDFWSYDIKTYLLFNKHKLSIENNYLGAWKA